MTIVVLYSVFLSEGVAVFFCVSVKMIRSVRIGCTCP